MTSFIRVIPLRNRPARHFNTKREYSQAEKDAEQRLIDARRALKAEFKKQWPPPPSCPPPEANNPDHPDAFLYWAIEWSAFECWQLQQRGYVAAFVTPHYWNGIEDEWLSNSGYEFKFDPMFKDDPYYKNQQPGVFDRESTAARVTLPFLMEGGEFALTYESYKQTWDDEPVKTHIESRKELRVGSEHGVYHGWMERDNGEMTIEIIALPKTAPQEVANRVAKAYGKIINLKMPDDYPAVMPVADTFLSVSNFSISSNCRALLTH